MFYRLKNLRARTNVMRSDELKLGKWHEFDTKLKFTAFDTFQWHVENDMTLDYLGWCVSTEEDVGDEQRQKAQEILDIYNWWKHHKALLKLIEWTWDIVTSLEDEKRLLVEEERIEKEVIPYLHRLVDISPTVWI